ncbi:bifunctional riboflavin kinase/FMN phosphatase isoform X3 [Cryptomeria japonica]|uniref:bifunctional riboflavin kinase/FMN phosphatase isoform X3 n=1 Tax=Cryptomeria japonica TaxID=3369 RepID=UPI0027D9E464|nr:bifunctional riboflavin kinase/FMN phosphatase isoform X3 [Cryptomeria japonica]
MRRCLSIYHRFLWHSKKMGENSSRNPKTNVILDLDGTLLDTECVVEEALKMYLAKYGKQWDGRGEENRLGKRPLEAASAIIQDYQLTCTPQQFMDEIYPWFDDMWSKVKPLPGAVRLIKHLNSHGVNMALASNSPRTNIEAKLSYQHGWKEFFSVIIGGDEVKEGKPSPDIFLEAAQKLQTKPLSCLVIEDSLPGVRAAKAAGMEVVAVPSIPKQAHLYTEADTVLSNLFDLRPEHWGLPPFDDWIANTLPVEPWYIGGPVIKGFGRGSKMLGIPTANLSADDFSILTQQACGVYFGWAGLAKHGIYKTVMSIGWNPYFNNSKKTIEPWLLHEFKEDFYGEELRLVVVGYIRPEANFPSLESLIERIHEDRHVAEEALNLPPYSEYQNHPFLSTIQSEETNN